MVCALLPKLCHWPKPALWQKKQLAIYSSLTPFFIRQKSDQTFSFKIFFTDNRSEYAYLKLNWF
jgi:hypothetical protein